MTPPIVQMAFLALKQSKILRSHKSNLGYAAQLFKCAAAVLLTYLFHLLHLLQVALAARITMGRTPF